MAKQIKDKKEKIEASLELIRQKLDGKKRYSIKNFLAIFIGLNFYIIIIFVIIGLEDGFELFGSPKEWFTAISICLFGTLLVSGLIFLIAPFFMKPLYKIQEKVLIGELAALDAEDLQTEIEKDFFTNLVKINFKYIDKYYLQTQVQADKSFSVSVTASIVAFLIIIAGIVLMYFDKTNSAYVATGTGVLSEFIAAVFFFLYNKTIVKMGEYHHKLVLTQNVSLALKISEEMPEADKVKSQSYLIQELIKDINLHLASNEK